MAPADSWPRGNLPKGIQRVYVLIGLACFTVAIALSFALPVIPIPRGDVAFTPQDGVSAFALFFLAAVVVERTLEPFSSYLVRAKEDTDKGVGKSKVDLANTAAAAKSGEGGTPDAKAEKATAEKAASAAKQAVKNGAFVIWGVATALSVFVAYEFALSMPSALGVTGVAVPLDLFATALVIGAGSKPLHDFISLIQKSSQAADKA